MKHGQVIFNVELRCFCGAEYSIKGLTYLMDSEGAEIDWDQFYSQWKPKMQMGKESPCEIKRFFYCYDCDREYNLAQKPISGKKNKKGR